MYGFAGPMFFAFDVAAQKALESGEHGLGSVIYNAVGPGPGGELFGVASGGRGVATPAASGIHGTVGGRVARYAVNSLRHASEYG